MPEPTIATPWPRRIVRIVVALVAVAVFVIVLRWAKSTGVLERALDWIRELGPWKGAVAFIVIYVAAVVLFVPAAIFTVGAGFVFGMLWGSVYVLIAALIAATV